jgi:hypothetical protein
VAPALGSLDVWRPHGDPSHSYPPTPVQREPGGLACLPAIEIEVAERVHALGGRVLEGGQPPRHPPGCPSHPPSYFSLPSPSPARRPVPDLDGPVLWRSPPARPPRRWVRRHRVPVGRRVRPVRGGRGWRGGRRGRGGGASHSGGCCRRPCYRPCSRRRRRRHNPCARSPPLLARPALPVTPGRAPGVHTGRRRRKRARWVWEPGPGGGRGRGGGRCSGCRWR